MADFRKCVFAFAVLALLLGSGGVANAQQAPAFQCIANAGVPPLVRSEGVTELVGDIVLNCDGGVPLPGAIPGQALPGNVTLPTVNIRIGPRIDWNAEVVEGAAATRRAYPVTRRSPRRSVGSRVHQSKRGRVLVSLLITSMGGKDRGSQRHQAQNPQVGDSMWRKGPPLRGGSAMEGTPGAAKRRFLRGSLRHAALLETQRKRGSGVMALVKARGIAGWTRWIESASPAGEVPGS
jgi:hypothetical protein